MVTVVSGQGGRFQSVCFPSNSPRETACSRYFPGTEAEVSAFCNYFLLCGDMVLPSKAEVSLYPF